MRRISAALGSLVFFVLAPGTAAGLVPWWLSRWRLEPPLLGWVAFRYLGVALMAPGLAVLVDSFARFAFEGRGTPAPLAPPEHLVVNGLYRYVRNPMYVAVLSLVIGQGLLFGNVRLFAYAAALWLFFHLYVLAYEEPHLRRTFGAEYEAYCRGVPRWVPRVGPWREAAAH